MGSVFRYIADTALKPAGREHKRTCHVCSRAGVDVYQAAGDVALPDGGCGDEVEVACVDCIRGGRVELSCAFQVDDVIRRYLDKQFRDRTYLFRLRRLAELAAAYRQTPSLPWFVQRQDWPLCCGDLTEFTGSPGGKKELIRLTDAGTYWEGQVKTNRVDFRETGPPESYREVSTFRCLACEQVFWAWQFT